MRSDLVVAAASGLLVAACSSSAPVAGHPPLRPTSPPGLGYSVPDGWDTFVNHLGKFTYSVPASWAAESCEDRGVGYVVATPNNLPCGIGEYENAWLFNISQAGDARAGAPFRGTLVGTSTVVVEGVTGKRFSEHTTQATGGLAPPANSDVILYVFYNGTRTYTFEYERWPMEPDRAADFDMSVQQDLRFSA